MQQTKSQEFTGTKITARRRRWLNRDRLIALLMIAPSALAIGVFVYGFIGWTGFISFTKWTGITPDYTFAGLENYQTIFSTGRFQTDIRNTIVFTLFFLIGCLSLGLLLAIMVDSRIRGEAIFRTIYLFPMSLSFVVTGVAWLWLFTPGNFPNDPTGINLLFHRMGLDFFQSAWITDTRVIPGWYPDWARTKIGVSIAMIPVVIAAIWQMSGFTMAMYLAGLRGIPEEVREAARVDGASEWQVFRRITFPLLRPITLSAIIILGHISLKIFDLILTMTGGGPGNATDVPGIYMYDITFNSNKIAQGAAVAVVMLLLVAVLTVPYLIYNAKLEVEQ
jgi:glucose/mannose transport system permease protein